MRWSSREETVPRSWLARRWGGRFFLALLCLVGGAVISIPFLSAQPGNKRISFFTSQTTYSLPVVDRGGSEYVGVLECLEPMGAVSAKPDGKKWKVKFRGVEAQFEEGKNRARIGGKNIELAAPFLKENGRGLVPLRSLQQVLKPLLATPIDFHESGRRVFIGVSPIRVSARKVEDGKVAFTFTSPVNPTLATEPGKLVMTFAREPIVGNGAAMVFNDKAIPSASLSEQNGVAELTVTGRAALLASFSEDRKTITVAQLPATQRVPQLQIPQTVVAPPSTQQAAPAVRVRPLIIIDAAHGGDNPGAALTDKVAEKDVTLAIARRLRHELQVRGIEAAMIRDGDTSISLEDRARAANASGASLYLALHATSSGSGVHVFTAMLPPQQRNPLSFVPVATAQAGAVGTSRAVASAISTELLKRDMQAVPLPASVAPLNQVAIAALAVEVAVPPGGTASDLTSASYQQSVAAALANALAAVQNRLPRTVR